MSRYRRCRNGCCDKNACPRWIRGWSASNVLDGVPVVRVLVPDNHAFHDLPPEYWELLQLFDGERTYEEIATLFTANRHRGLGRLGVGVCHRKCRRPILGQDLQEKNSRFRDELMGKRRARTQKKTKWSNLAETTFPAWDPDAALTKVHDRVRFILYQFLLLSLAMFAFAAYVLVSHSTEIGHDNLSESITSPTRAWPISSSFVGS